MPSHSYVLAVVALLTMSGSIPAYCDDPTRHGAPMPSPGVLDTLLHVQAFIPEVVYAGEHADVQMRIINVSGRTLLVPDVFDDPLAHLELYMRDSKGEYRRTMPIEDDYYCEFGGRRHQFVVDEVRVSVGAPNRPDVVQIDAASSLDRRLYSLAPIQRRASVLGRVSDPVKCVLLVCFRKVVKDQVLQFELRSLPPLQGIATSAPPDGSPLSVLYWFAEETSGKVVLLYSRWAPDFVRQEPANAMLSDKLDRIRLTDRFIPGTAQIRALEKGLAHVAFQDMSEDGQRRSRSCLIRTNVEATLTFSVEWK